MKILAVIPARGGSKRLPGKNTRQLNGKPLIQWSIEAALGVNDVSKVLVSTDCKEIAKISSRAGAEVPFIRPAELADDESKTVDVVRHAIDNCAKRGEKYDYILLLQPTSPLRNSEHIKASINFLQMKNADAIVSVCKCEHSPLWTNKLPINLSMDRFVSDEIKCSRSQDLPTYYRLNGAIYLTNISCLYKENSLFLSSNMYAFVMESKCSADIDNELDFILADTIMRNRESNA